MSTSGSPGLPGSLGPRARARLALLFATLVWGTSFVVIQRALEDLPVFHLLAFRFTIGALLLAPLARGVAWTRELVRDGLVLGITLGSGFALQTAGLLWTTPSRSAFLTGLSVVLVPLFALALGRPLRAGPLAGSLCAAVGLWVLYRPAAGAAGDPGVSPGFNQGDVLTVACAAVFAVYVLLIERAVARHRLAPLAILQFTLIALLAAPSLLLSPPTAREVTGYPLFAVLVMGVFATALAFLCQHYAQRHLTPVEAGVIFALEPVLAALTSVLVGVEVATPSLALGGALVVGAILLTELGGGPGDAPPAAAATPRS